MTRSQVKWAAILAAAVSASSLPVATLRAGPPYVTDDPEPTPLGGWEIYGYTAGEGQKGDYGAEAGLDINYGIARDTQFTVTLPVQFSKTSSQRLQRGLGDVEVGLKYLLVHQREGSLLPDIALYPAFVIPTGAARLGAGHSGIALPVWMQKDLGSWSIGGGTSYAINHGAAAKDSLFLGVAITRELSERLTIGGEIFRASAEATDEQREIGVNGGVTYALSEHYNLAASAGPLWAGRRRSSAFYLAVEFHK